MHNLFTYTVISHLKLRTSGAMEPVELSCSEPITRIQLSIILTIVYKLIKEDQASQSKRIPLFSSASFFG